MARGTTPTQIRIPPDVKAAAKDRAGVEGKTLSEVVVDFLREYASTPPAHPGARPGRGHRTDPPKDTT